jgi:nicotinamidase/pyrazinamidase
MTVVKPSVQQLTRTFQKARKRVLDVVDNQVDFMQPAAALSVPGADAIIEPTNQFFRDIPIDFYDFGLLKFDTHFSDEYHRSPESQSFPNPHCVYGTNGWDLAVDINPLFAKMPVYIMAKNEFDMWGSNPTGIAVDDIAFSDPERIAYNNLFNVIAIDDAEEIPHALETPNAGTNRDVFMDDNDIGPGTVVTLIGVASDFCDTQALIGYLRRGVTVVIASDLVKGIGGDYSPAPQTGTFEEVIENLAAGQRAEFAPAGATDAVRKALAEGRLMLAPATDIVAAMEATARPKPLFNLGGVLKRKDRK